MEEKKETTEAAAEAKHGGGKCLTNRRQFLGAFAGVVGAFGAGIVGVPLLASFKPVQRGKPEPVVLKKDDIPLDGDPVQSMYAGNAFLAFRKKAGDGEEIKCISLVCTHLGCLVKWEPQNNRFFCPCHDGWFDADGVNKGGPPPEPLEKLEFKVAGDNVIVGGGE